MKAGHILRRHPDDTSAIDGGAALRPVVVNLAEHPLAWLHARGHVSDRQLAAGDRLRRDYERAGLNPSTTMRWDAAPQSHQRRGAPSHGSATMAQIDARGRFDAALAAVGAGLGDICWRVICAGEGIQHAERELGWPARSGRLVLTLALDRLADHYRC